VKDNRVRRDVQKRKKQNRESLEELNIGDHRPQNVGKEARGPVARAP